MLKDRQLLLEQEIFKHKQLCGALYLKIIKGNAIPGDSTDYDMMRSKLAGMMADHTIIVQMISDGHDSE